MIEQDARPRARCTDCYHSGVCVVRMAVAKFVKDTFDRDAPVAADDLAEICSRGPRLNGVVVCGNLRNEIIEEE